MVSSVAKAHHEEFHPINWDAIKEYEIIKDAFNPKYYDKFPYGFIQVGCERTSKIVNGDMYKDQKKELNREIKEAKINNDILAFFLQCNAIEDIRHPPEKEVMVYSKMKKSYKEAYRLSADLTFGGEGHPWYIKDAALLIVASRKAENISKNPDIRKEWLINYYKLQK